jgi:hypothetical protein
VAHGLSPYLTLTPPGPRWAHATSPERLSQPAYRPKVGEFGKFVHAVGLRYSGRYRDENDGRPVLPRVVIWGINNEPNQPRTLTPSAERSPITGRMTPAAPHIYRNLYRAATSALRRTGHAGDTILMGQLAPLGERRLKHRGRMFPAKFIREMFCLDDGLRPYRGAEARARGCQSFAREAPFLVSGFAHHPYMQHHPPGWRDGNRDSINISNIGDLPALLDRVAARTGKIRRGLPVFITEYGWQTNPPDPVQGVSPENQAAWMNVSDRLAYDQPRIAAVNQFMLRDAPPRTEYARFLRRYRPGTARYRQYLGYYWYTWQSGLFDGRTVPKPSLAAYRLPFDAIAAAPGQVRLWGQLRFQPNGQAGAVTIQFRPQGSPDWTTVLDSQPVTNPMGFFDVTIPAAVGGTYRAVTAGGFGFLVSREVSISG